MPFDQLTPHNFTPAGVRLGAPAVAGLYGVSSAKEWIYIGAADDIRTALLALLADPASPPMRHAPTGFVFEPCQASSRAPRLERLLIEYRPVCNPSAGQARPNVGVRLGRHSVQS
jgi:hypothetical protein